ncbi:MAG TPA: SRPBCC domain-containing protein [Anaerolineae bacterium]|nr:SRPBCC domain-containing protein [Anaerolineae bacterium]
MTTPVQGITLTRTILVPPPQVWAAFATAAGWCTWCCETAVVDARVGGRYHIYTQGYNARGVFTQLILERSLAFTWDGDDEPPMRVCVLLDGQGRSTTLTFTVTVLGSLDARPGFVDFLERTWGRVLDNLKAVLEGERAG